VIYYTYLYLREDGTPYYVGKGTRKRVFEKTNRSTPPPKDRRRILLQEHPCENDAFAAEIFLISYYGRKNLGAGPLRNLTDGGDGASGAKPSAVTKQKMSASHKKRWKDNPPPPRSLEYRAKMSERLRGEKSPMFGKRMSVESRLKLSKSRMGWVMSPEQRKKSSEMHKKLAHPWLSRGRVKGYHHSEETRRKISIASLGNRNGCGPRRPRSEAKRPLCEAV
jgi:hypothetical protein